MCSLRTGHHSPSSPRALRHDLQPIIRQRPLQRERLGRERGEPRRPLLRRRQDDGPGLGMNRRDDPVRVAREEAEELVLALDRVRLRAPHAMPLRSDPREGEQRPLLFEREPRRRRLGLCICVLANKFASTRRRDAVAQRKACSRPDACIESDGRNSIGGDHLHFDVGLSSEMQRILGKVRGDDHLELLITMRHVAEKQIAAASDV